MTGALAGGIGLVGAQNTGKVMVWVGIGMYAAIGFGSPIGIRLMDYQGLRCRRRRHRRVFRAGDGIGGFAKRGERHQGERLPFRAWSAAWRRSVPVWRG